MAKSILDIDVNDQSFRQFQKLWQQYQTQLQQTPLSWRKIGQAQQQGIQGFRQLVIEQAAAIGQARMLAEAEKAAQRLLRGNADVWRDIRRNTTATVVNVRDMTTQLLKWSTVVGAVSGLLGAGGLWGINRLAEGAAAGRQRALGLGTTFGEQKAFGTAFDRLVEPGQFLGGVEGSLTDISRRHALYNAGLGEDQLKGTTGQVAARLLNQIKKLADQTPDALLSNVFRARGLDQFITEDSFRRIKRTAPEELAGLQRRFGQGTANSEVSTKDQLAYQNFITTLGEAQNKIETVFIRGIAPLIPGLEKLSTGVSDLVQAFLGSKAIKEWIDEGGKGLEELAKKVGSPEFKTDVEDFVTAVSKMAGSAKEFGKFVADPLGYAKKAVTDDFKREGENFVKDWERVKKFFKGAGEAQTQYYGGVPTNPATGGAPGTDNNGAAPPASAAQPAKKSASENVSDAVRGAIARPDLAYGIKGVGIPVKPGAGVASPEMKDLADKLYGRVPGIERATAFNDNYHKGTGSAHEQDRAFDLTVSDPSKSEDVATAIRRALREMNIEAKVINEYRNPSANATGGHLHIQTDVKVTNATGSNVFISANQAKAIQ